MMHKLSAAKYCSVLVGVVVGCEAPAATTTEQIQQLSDVWAGHVISGHEVRSFRRCGTTREVWVTDLSNGLWTAYEDVSYGQQPYEELFAIVRGTFGTAPSEGFGETYPAQLAVIDVLYLAQEGHDCSLDTEAFWARGAGNEPFWSYLISESGIVFSSMDGTRLEWTNPEVDVSSDTIRVTGGDADVVIDLTANACFDSMSGAMHGYTTNVMLGDVALHGCAIRGSGPLPE